MIELEFQLFGAFRKYDVQDSPLRLCLEGPATVEEIKSILVETLQSRRSNFTDSQLVIDSALANDRRVLSSHERVVASCVLSILPPVCGG